VGSSQMVLSFQLAGTDEALTAHGGLAVHVLPLVLMLAGSGRTLEDLRVLRRDEGLRALLLPKLNEMPTSDATGDWLRRTGAKEGRGLVGLQHVNGSVFRRLLLSDEGVDYTLDFDETQIVAEKHEARYTYKGEKGYMPMVGHIAELGVVIGHEFREGNAAPAAARNLEFLQACERNMPKGKRIVAVRADSAAYPAAIFNWCEVTAKVFAIGADQDAAVKAAIAGIPESDWKTFRDGEIAEMIHCMNKTDKAFRLIVLRRPREQDLFKRLSCHRQQSSRGRRGDDDAMVLQTRRRQRKSHQGSEDRLRHRIHALRYIPSQRDILRHRRVDLQSISGFSQRCARQGVGAHTGADRPLEVVSNRGQDRPAWQANLLEDQLR
jgi:Transposase DDE domain group 1